MKATILFLFCTSAFGQMVGLPSPGPGTKHAAGSTGPSPVLVSHTGMSVYSIGSNTGTSSAINCTGANLIVILSTDYGGVHDASTDTIGDSAGNTYSHGSSWAGPSAIPGGTAIFYVLNPSVTSAMTFHGAGLFNTIFVQCWSGISTTSNPQIETGATCPFGPTTCSPGSVTPAENGDLIIAGVGFTAPPPLAIDSGFTISDQNSADTGAFAYLIQTGGGATVSPTWSSSYHSYTSAVIMVFKHA